MQIKARRALLDSDFIPRNMRHRKQNDDGEDGAGEVNNNIITQQTVSRPSAADLEAERYYREEAEREAKDLGTDESEEEFGDLDDGLALAPPVGNYDWSDRYRPRKPRYFNRVHTGYEWTRYNQTHYEWV